MMDRPDERSPLEYYRMISGNCFRLKNKVANQGPCLGLLPWVHTRFLAVCDTSQPLVTATIMFLLQVPGWFLLAFIQVILRTGNTAPVIFGSDVHVTTRITGKTVIQIHNVETYWYSVSWPGKKAPAQAGGVL